MVADDGQRALFAQHAVGIFVRALDYVLKAARDREFDQFGENGAHGVIVAVGVEVVVDLEIGRGRLLHGLGLGDDVLHFIDVVFDPVVATSGRLAHFFGHSVRGLRHGPGGDRNPRADLGADQLPRGGCRGACPLGRSRPCSCPRSCLGVDPVKGRGADVSCAQGVAVWRVADVLAEAL